MDTSPTKVENGAGKIAEIMSTFLRPAESSDAEMLRLVAKYSLQLNHEQQLIVNRLQIETHNTLIPLAEREKLKMLIEDYQTTKRYHDTIEYVGRTIDAISLKRFWSIDGIKGQVTQQKQ